MKIIDDFIFIGKFKKLLGIVCFSGFLFGVTFISFDADAQDACADVDGGIAECTCDENYMSSLKAHATMTGQRTLSQYENIIVKPDSVLEYTCFDMFLGQAGHGIAKIFSNKEDGWNGTDTGREPSGNDTTTAASLQANVLAEANSYLSSNFGHNYLGGKYTGDAIRDPDMPSTALTGDDAISAYNGCAVMQGVWTAAKCHNFTSGAGENFSTFEEYKSGQVDPETFPRTLPEACQGFASWDTHINAATGETSTWWAAGQGSKTQTAFNVVSNALKPGNCSGSQPTGVKDSDGNEDGFCTNPGCSYSGSGCE